LVGSKRATKVRSGAKQRHRLGNIFLDAVASQQQQAEIIAGERELTPSESRGILRQEIGLFDCSLDSNTEPSRGFRTIRTGGIVVADSRVC
jgi:hypothetical protein